jgi:hypothetical protein
MHCIIALSIGLQFMSRKGDGWDNVFEWSNELMGWVDFWSKFLESIVQVSRVWIAHQMCIWSLSSRHGGNVVTALPWKLVCQMYQHAFSSRMESPVHVTCWDHHHCHTFHGASKLPTIKFAYIEKSIANDSLLFWHSNESKKKILFWALLMSLLFGCIETEWRLTIPFMVFMDGLQVVKLVVDQIYMLMNKSVMLAYSMVMHY